MTALLFGFAWVASTETTFNSSHHRYDEPVVSFKRELAEGQIPKLEVEVGNPQIGLLATGRKQWVWFSWNNNGTWVPLFFGQLVGIPTDLLGPIVKLQFIARSLTYISDKQIAAEPLKVRPYYDPLFIDLNKRDDPDTILEGYSKLWHIDPTTLVTTASDILIGEDGTETFIETDVPFDSVKVNVGQQPLTSVYVDATVSWTQEAIGTVDIGSNRFISYSGDGIINEWPKPGASMGAGWSCFSSSAVDTLLIQTTFTASYGYNWQNANKSHSQGDTMSISTSVTQPQFNGPYMSYNLQEIIVVGIINPYNVDAGGNPDPINIPASASIKSSNVPRWQVDTTLNMRYDASRKRNERATFLLKSDIQPILINPTLAQQSEIIKKSSIDVGAPIYKLTNWTALAGTVVSVGDLCFPNNPTLPGQTSTQQCITGGTAGLTEPAFSNIPGNTTNDNTVVWVSLGDTAPPTTAPDWAKQTNTPLSDMIIPRAPFYALWTDLIKPGLAQLPQVGVSISFGQIIKGSNGSYQICQLSGITDIVQPNFSLTWGVEVNDGTVLWQSLGTTLPDGSTAFIATGAGFTGNLLPQFGTVLALGSTIIDGGVTWRSLGPVDIPVGGYPGNIIARSYFSRDRGLQSLEYLIALARARLRYRARAITVSFECHFERAAMLTCRKNAAIYDFRLPGNVAAGKIIASTIELVGDSGKLFGTVSIGCSIGKGNSIIAADGTPVYVDVGYENKTYQFYEGAVVLMDPIGADVGYTPPADAPVDDGLVFPLTRSQIVVYEGVHGSLVDQEAGILNSFETARAVNLTQYTAQYDYGIAPRTAFQSIQLQQLQLITAKNSIAFELQKNPIWYDLQIKPVTNGPFGAEYNVTVSNLTTPKTIDLSATT